MNTLPALLNHEEVSVSQIGLNERWFQEKICENPSFLPSLGNPVLEGRKVNLPAGRIDIILYDEKSNTEYQVKVQPGRLNADHLLKAVEYWNHRKQLSPERNHCTALVVERFSGVLPHIKVPLIIFEVKTLKVNYNFGGNC